MTRGLVAPRWAVLLITVLSILSFAFVYARAYQLDSELHLTKIELEKAQEGPDKLLIIDSLDIPVVGTLTRFPEMQIGFLCSLGIVVGAVYLLLRGEQSVESDDR